MFQLIQKLDRGVASEERVLLVAQDAGGEIVGTVIAASRTLRSNTSRRGLNTGRMPVGRNSPLIFPSGPTPV